MELVAPIDTNKCYYCHRDITVKDRSTWFHMKWKDMGPQGPGCSPIKQYPMAFIKGNRNIKQRIEERLQEKQQSYNQKKRRVR